MRIMMVGKVVSKHDLNIPLKISSMRVVLERATIVKHTLSSLDADRNPLRNVSIKLCMPQI